MSPSFKALPHKFLDMLKPNKYGQKDQGPPTVPLEIIDHVIDYCHDDKAALLLLSRLCMRTLIRSRLHLFHTIEVSHKDKRLDDFLALLDGRWTSLTPAVENIHLRGLFQSDYRYSTKRKSSRVTTNLCNLKSLSISSGGLLRTYWLNIPPHVLDILFMENLENLELHAIEMRVSLDLDDLLKRVHPSIKTLAISNLFFGDYQCPSDAAALLRRLDFRLMDAASIGLFQEVLESMIVRKTTILVHTFLCNLFTKPLTRDLVTFTARFLNHVGPSIQHFLFDLSGPYAEHDAASELCDLIDISSCTNLRRVSIFLTTDEGFSQTSQVSNLWRLLSTLPTPNTLKELKLTVQPYGLSLEEKLRELELLEWSNLVSRFQTTFPNLRNVTVTVMAYDDDLKPHLKTIRQISALRALDEDGIAEFVSVLSDVNEMPSSVSSPSNAKLEQFLNYIPGAALEASLD